MSESGGDYVVAKGRLSWVVHDTALKCDVVRFNTEDECYAWCAGYDYALVVNR